MNRADGPAADPPPADGAAANGQGAAAPNLATGATDEQDVAPDGPNPRSRRLKLMLRLLGAAVAVLALGLCVRALVQSWPTVQRGLQHANIGLLVVALLLSALGSCGLAFLWQRTLAVFDRPYPYVQAATWFFAGELGKYLPGSVWAVVGRGELAHRAGVRRGIAYACTLMSMGLMCVGGGVVCGILVPIVAAGGGRVGAEWLLVGLVPLGILFAVPAVHGAIFRLLNRFSRGRLALEPTTFGRMSGLIASAVPSWLLVGGASVLITTAFGYPQHPAQVAFAAIAAWIVGFLAIPVPAGAGVRELVFVVSSGLDPGAAVSVAAMARVMLILTDAAGGGLSIAAIGTARRRARSDRPDPPDRLDEPVEAVEPAGTDRQQAPTDRSTSRGRG